MAKKSTRETRMGRPPTEGTTLSKPFMLRLPEDLSAEIDQIVAELPDKKERSIAIRMLLREAIALRRGKKK
jgi:metal-responsive CopG/Arc/MetJ family transcriptional regulator